MGESKISTSPELYFERVTDEIAALQIKVSVMEKLLLSSEEMYENYNRMVDELGIAYVREREAVRKTLSDAESAVALDKHVTDRRRLN